MTWSSEFKITRQKCRRLSLPCRALDRGETQSLASSRPGGSEGVGAARLSPWHWELSQAIFQSGLHFHSSKSEVSGSAHGTLAVTPALACGFLFSLKPSPRAPHLRWLLTVWLGGARATRLHFSDLKALGPRLSVNRAQPTVHRSFRPFLPLPKR